MSGRRGAVQIAPEIRGAAIRALKIVEESTAGKKYSGMSLSEIFASMIEEGDVLRVIDAVSKFTPKELLMEVEGKVSVSVNTNLLTEEVIGSLIEHQRDERTLKAV
jgi:hypothetical protein